MCDLEVAQGDWQSAWSDIFDGSSINTNTRTFAIVNGSRGWGNNDLELGF